MRAEGCSGREVDGVTGAKPDKEGMRNVKVWRGLASVASFIWHRIIRSEEWLDASIPVNDNRRATRSLRKAR